MLEIPTAAISKRRARNRVAQRSFRERQARYVKELEQKVAENPKDESSRLNVAEQEIRRLRGALQATKSRILSLSTALSGITDNIDASLDALSDSIEIDLPNTLNQTEGASSLDRSFQDRIDFEEGPFDEEAVLHQSTDEDIDARDNVPLPETNNVGVISASQATSGDDGDHGLSRYERPSTTENDHDNTIPNTYIIPPTGLIKAGGVAQQANSHTFPHFSSHEDVRWSLNADCQATVQAPFQFFPSAGPEESWSLPLTNAGFPPGTASFPSIFSAHLAVCEYFIKQNQAYRDRLQPKGMESLAKLINTMVNMFVHTCWPGMRVWWAYIQSSAVVEKLMRWRLDACLDTYKALPMTHRPTALQLSTAHPAIIDWAFFPSIRDRMIEMYSHSWMLDEIVCELVKAYVVEADLTKLVTGMESLPPQTGYFSIWEIVQTIAREDRQQSQPNFDLWGNGVHLDEDLFAESSSPFEIEQAGSDGTWIKMPLDQIYQSRKVALKLFKLLRMDDRRIVKLDPAFAAAHPELCDDVTIIATGLDCTLRGNSTPVSRPKPLTRDAILNYKMMLWKTNL